MVKLTKEQRESAKGWARWKARKIHVRASDEDITDLVIRALRPEACSSAMIAFCVKEIRRNLDKHIAEMAKINIFL